MGAGKCRLCWLPPMGGEVLVPAYAAVRGRSRSHTESGGLVWASDHPRTDEFGELSGALLGQPRWSGVCARRRSQLRHEEPHLTAGRCR